ncbi:phosphoribosyltransferase family protein [Paenibacillus sp. FSL F4-0125]|uniref:phosphoribosyltransferase family protein n=1 Tax=Paenibacillus sp. FSL F4-0125 TaxID=2954730 RepID=UPI004046CBC4
MNNSILSDYYPRTNLHTYNIVENLQVTVTETSNPFHLPADTLFSMAARINKKRSFLFVSKVLGKHIPVNPYTPLLSGAALALLLYQEMNDDSTDKGRMDDLLNKAVHGLIHPESAKEAYQHLLGARLVLPKPVVFIGFAETATALGHSVYNMFADAASYIHTTREHILDLESIVSFEEEHSHAVDHSCYALNAELLSGTEPIILVDDEITTGNTAINTICDIQSKFPREEYVVVSILDWRSGNNLHTYSELEQELGIRIKSLCLLQGSIVVKGTPLLHARNDKDLCPSSEEAEVVTTYVVDGLERLQVTSIDSYGDTNASPYVKYSGRFGLDSLNNDGMDEGVTRIAAQLRELREVDSRTLVMGVGEFMYLPMRIAAEMGEGVSYQSSTRSPIHPEHRADYGVHSAFAYPSAGDPEITNFIYNVAPGQYDEIFVLIERDVPHERMKPMLDILKALARHKVHLIVLTPEGRSGGPQDEGNK